MFPKFLGEPASPPDPCLGNRCKHDSKCVATRNNEYVCKCRPGFRGKYCEQGEEECKYNRDADSTNSVLVATAALLEVIGLIKLK